MSFARLLLLTQLATTLPLVGLIWLVQVVAYPLFAQVGLAEFRAYHTDHSNRITFVVAPLMIVEVVSSVWWVRLGDLPVSRPLAWAGAALAVFAWALTAFVAVPAHNILARGFDARAHARLVRTNWLRTITWTVRGAILLFAVAAGGTAAPCSSP